jgi:tetratricopeptide (TPR) repeat protein
LSLEEPAQNGGSLDRAPRRLSGLLSCFGARICRLCALVLACGIAGFPRQATDVGHQIALDLQAGRYEEARESADQALKRAPRDPRLWTLDGIALANLKQKEQALAAFQKALQLSPDYLPALEAAAQLQYEAGSDAAEPLLRQILKQRPDDQTSHAMLAAIAFRKGDCPRARDEFAASRAISNDSFEAWRECGKCLVRQKRISQAVPVFEHLAQLQPDNQQAHYELAVVYFLDGQYAAVIKALEPVSTRDDSGEALALLGEAYEATFETTKAIAALRQAIAASPKASDYYADLAYIFQAHRQFREGLSVADEGLHKDPDAAPLYVVRGILYSELAEFDKGLADFAKAETLDSNVELSSEARGLAELQRNDLAEAERVARERIRRHPENGFLYYVLGETLRKKGASATETGEAVAALQKAIQLDPKLNLARNALASIYLAQGKTDDAIAQSRAAYRTNPSDETALYHLILALRKSGRADEIPPLMKQLSELKKHNRPLDFAQQESESINQAASGENAFSGPQ